MVYNLYLKKRKKNTLSLPCPQKLAVKILHKHKAKYGQFLEKGNHQVFQDALTQGLIKVIWTADARKDF